MVYYYVDEHNHEIATRKGIAWLIREARPAGAGWIVVPHLSNMEAIARYRGFAAFKILTKPPHRGVISGLFLKLVSQNSLPDSYDGQPVLAIFPSADFLDRLHSIPGANKMLAVPWSRNEIQSWIDRTKAKVHEGHSTRTHMTRTAMNES